MLVVVLKGRQTHTDKSTADTAKTGAKNTTPTVSEYRSSKKDAATKKRHSQASRAASKGWREGGLEGKKEKKKAPADAGPELGLKQTDQQLSRVPAQGKDCR